MYKWLLYHEIILKLLISFPSWLHLQVTNLVNWWTKLNFFDFMSIIWTQSDSSHLSPTSHVTSNNMTRVTIDCGFGAMESISNSEDPEQHWAGEIFIVWCYSLFISDRSNTNDSHKATSAKVSRSPRMITIILANYLVTSNCWSAHV